MHQVTLYNDRYIPKVNMRCKITTLQIKSLAENSRLQQASEIAYEPLTAKL